MKICYRPWTPKPAAMLRIQEVNEIITHYMKNRLTLTLRQLYYRLVGTGKIKENNIRSYKNLQRIVNDGRLAGLIDWSAIEDRGRHISNVPSWSDVPEFLNDAQYWFKLDLWAEQPRHVEVWVEKDALLGVLERACGKWRVNYTSSRGNTSQSEAFDAAQRFKSMGKPCVILHLADHDPTGVDMTRDLQDRFQMFGAPVEVHRFALNMEQILERNPPPQFAKESDSRTGGYVAQFGDECWELDAIEPMEMIELLSERIQEFIDMAVWKAGLERELAQREPIEEISDRYDEVLDFLHSDSTEEE